MKTTHYSPNIPVDCWSRFYICSHHVTSDLSEYRLYFYDRSGGLYIMFEYSDEYSIAFMREVDNFDSINSKTSRLYRLYKSTASISMLYITYNNIKEFNVFDDCVQEAHKLIMEHQL